MWSWCISCCWVWSMFSFKALSVLFLYCTYCQLIIDFSCLAFIFNKIMTFGDTVAILHVVHQTAVATGSVINLLYCAWSQSGSFCQDIKVRSIKIGYLNVTWLGMIPGRGTPRAEIKPDCLPECFWGNRHQNNRESLSSLLYYPTTRNKCDLEKNRALCRLLTL